MDDLLRQIEAVARREGALRVRRVRVSLGALSHMTPEHFAEHFAAVTSNTLAEGAAVECQCLADPAAADAQGIRLRSLDLEYPE